MSPVPNNTKKEIKDLSSMAADPNLYKPINYFSQLGVAALAPYSKQQLSNVGIHAIKLTNGHVRGLSDWYLLPARQIWLFEINVKLYERSEDQPRKIHCSTLQITLANICKM